MDGFMKWFQSIDEPDFELIVKFNMDYIGYHWDLQYSHRYLSTH